MGDRDCATFLEWALPQCDLRWPGFFKVRRQVCKRLKRRMRELSLGDFPAYRSRLEADPAEWGAFDECCLITISRFFRDRGVFGALRTYVLPDIAARVAREGRVACIWSAGCASGEEPYTLKIIWDCEVALFFPDARVSILATDVDDTMLARARRGCFEPSSLRELPPNFIEQAFDRVGPLYSIKTRYREGVEFLRQDLRRQVPALLFDLILCRYVAFTYFAEPLQERVLGRIMDRLAPNGYLTIGTHEQLPKLESSLTPLSGALQILQRGLPKWHDTLFRSRQGGCSTY